MTRRLVFIGVTTGRSQVMRLFPDWAAVLEIAAEVVGMDLPLDATPAAYRDAVKALRDDASAAGALVTSHKVAILRHAGDLFDDLDPWARRCREISCIARRDGRLMGWATDPVASAAAMEAILGPGYWRDHAAAEVLCLGAGGSGTAISVALLRAAERPARIVLTGPRPERLDEVRAIHAGFDLTIPIDYVAVRSPADSDAVLGGMAPGSLVINATGLGKDRPGSPLSGEARFPRDAIAWDVNYRGDLVFLDQAARQLPPARVHDGWDYFLRGWSEVIARVFDVSITPERFAAIEAASESARPRRPR